MEGRMTLREEDFSAAERLLLDLGAIKIFGFRYCSGVCALRIENRRGHIVVLPFQGQQVWDAVFGGRSLKMKSFFDEPALSTDLLASYGAFTYARAFGDKYRAMPCLGKASFKVRAGYLDQEMASAAERLVLSL